MNLFFKKDKAALEREHRLAALKAELEQAQNSLRLAESNFNMAASDDLCDAAIYERAAASARYAYLIKEIKKMSDDPQEIETENEKKPLDSQEFM